ncbi:hypothetical protein [Helicobacter sp. MIT 99-5507]|uniref:hypothetical protein n=1 Tax=Helicobacter sp. MIT 99-5507 TaxID=152489 RepID=UPI000E1EA1C6|nr:hypothetical protein [Helicobacter sp. MIT 99-5507]RDU57570.1 hypothetical protein CQA42_06545 [Helicobacter sp. MIT 99-5507]
MINRILNITKIVKNFEQQTNYNNTLPLLLQILDKTKNGYKLKLGNNIIEARSAKELQVGRNYLATIKENKNGEIIISNLVNRPKILEVIKDSTLKFEINELKELFKDSKFMQNLSENLEQKISLANSKDDFLFLTHSLIALNKKIINLVIKDKNKEILLQIKKRKKDKIEFSAVFNNLGIINGSIYTNQILIIKTQFNHIKKILESNIKKLEGHENFDEIHILYDEDMEILFDLYGDNILDIEI